MSKKYFHNQDPDNSYLIFFLLQGTWSMFEQLLISESRSLFCLSLSWVSLCVAYTHSLLQLHCVLKLTDILKVCLDDNKCLENVFKVKHLSGSPPAVLLLKISHKTVYERHFIYLRQWQNADTVQQLQIWKERLLWQNMNKEFFFAVSLIVK